MSLRARVGLALAAIAAVCTSCVTVAQQGSAPTTTSSTTTSSTTTTSTTTSTTTTLAAFPAPVTGAEAGFVAFGDAGTGGAIQLQVADQMEHWVATSHRVDALVEAGDDVYPTGDPSRFEAALDTPYADLRTGRPLWVALGNHDVQEGHGAEQLRYLGLPDLPYAKTLPEVQLLFLDANHPDEAQAQWLDARLSEPGPMLRVVVFHQPAYSCASHGSTPAVVRWWVPILEAHRVALVISGHDHYYERFVSTNDVTYVVTGGGGAATYWRQTVCTGVPTSRATAKRHHFVGVEIVDGVLTLTAVASTGEVLDRATISRSG